MSTIDVGVSLLASTTVREKSLKVVQYAARLAIYNLKGSVNDDEALRERLKAFAKAASTARRLFKLGRWIKHFNDLPDAIGERDPTLRVLLLAEFALNLSKDTLEDVSSLRRFGVLTKDVVRFDADFYADFADLTLAVVSIALSILISRRESEKIAKLSEKSTALDPAERQSSIAKSERKLFMTRLQIIKFLADIGKDAYEVNLPVKHEGFAHFCAMVAGVVSAHKAGHKVLAKKK